MEMEAGWRELEVGEMTRNGDEYLSDWDRTWQSVDCIGETINEDHVEFRRKITKPSTDTDRATELAEAHWDYVKRVLVHSGIEVDEVARTGFHYKSAFIHGYKHAMEDADV